MITWKSGLYVSETAMEDRKKILGKIRRHELQFGVFVIALAYNGKDIFDVIPSYMLSADGYKGKDIEILGIAVGKDEALSLAARMITDVYKETGGYDVRRYFG